MTLGRPALNETGDTLLPDTGKEQQQLDTMRRLAKLPQMLCVHQQAQDDVCLSQISATHISNSTVLCGPQVKARVWFYIGMWFEKWNGETKMRIQNRDECWVVFSSRLHGMCGCNGKRGKDWESHTEKPGRTKYSFRTTTVPVGNGRIGL